MSLAGISQSSIVSFWLLLLLLPTLAFLIFLEAESSAEEALARGCRVWVGEDETEREDLLGEPSLGTCKRGSNYASS